ncbi:hypothetical protein [Sphingomonas sp.]|uniref:hypothetical protein n=1 Tax=Sphingomonas sp. TaxID=28214 RepID=UPI0025E4EB4B|nr:hypothetical protein [Sphingomonas sp.]
MAIIIAKLSLAGFTRILSDAYFATASFNSISPFAYVQPVYAPLRTYAIEARITFDGFVLKASSVSRERGEASPCSNWTPSETGRPSPLTKPAMDASALVTRVVRREIQGRRLVLQNSSDR